MKKILKVKGKYKNCKNLRLKKYFASATVKIINFTNMLALFGFGAKFY